MLIIFTGHVSMEVTFGGRDSHTNVQILTEPEFEPENFWLKKKKRNLSVPTTKLPLQF